MAHSNYMNGSDEARIAALSKGRIQLLVLIISGVLLALLAYFENAISDLYTADMPLLFEKPVNKYSVRPQTGFGLKFSVINRTASLINAADLSRDAGRVIENSNPNNLIRDYETLQAYFDIKIVEPLDGAVVNSSIVRWKITGNAISSNEASGSVDGVDSNQRDVLFHLTINSFPVEAQKERYSIPLGNPDLELGFDLSDYNLVDGGYELRVNMMLVSDKRWDHDDVGNITVSKAVSFYYVNRNTLMEIERSVQHDQQQQQQQQQQQNEHQQQHYQEYKQTVSSFSAANNVKDSQEKSDDVPKGDKAPRNSKLFKKLGEMLQSNNLKPVSGSSSSSSSSSSTSSSSSSSSNSNVNVDKLVAPAVGLSGLPENGRFDETLSKDDSRATPPEVSHIALPITGGMASSASTTKIITSSFLNSLIESKQIEKTSSSTSQTPFSNSNSDNGAISKQLMESLAILDSKLKKRGVGLGLGMGSAGLSGSGTLSSNGNLFVEKILDKSSGSSGSGVSSSPINSAGGEMDSESLKSGNSVASSIVISSSTLTLSLSIPSSYLDSLYFVIEIAFNGNIIDITQYVRNQVRSAGGFIPSKIVPNDLGAKEDVSITISDIKIGKHDISIITSTSESLKKAVISRERLVVTRDK